MLGLKRNSVELKEHESIWKDEFVKEKAILSSILQKNVLSINHIGSTAIPCICAKPILDIAVEVDGFDIMGSLDEAMQANGFIHRSMHDESGKRLYVKGGEDYRTHHVHFFEKGSKELKDHLFFRDYLIDNISVAKKYEELKRKLAFQFPCDREKYTEGKSEFIRSILSLQGNSKVELSIFNNEFWQAIDKLISESELVIDRPKGSRHPRYPEIIYQVDYGYLKGTASMDGSGIDVWKGTMEIPTVDAVMCIVDLVKKDSEIKLLYGCTEEEKNSVYKFHNESEFMKGILIKRKEE